MKHTITSDKRLQLIGLLTLAKYHNRMIQDLAKAAREITGEDDTEGHTADAIYCDYPVDTLLSKLNITVK